MAKKEHRGRFQAQGEGLEASESWSQDEPLTADNGLELLNKLKEKIPKSEVKKRERAFEKAADYVERGRKAGGLDPQTKTFKMKGTDARVDIEIISGKAFVSLILVLIALLWLLKQMNL